ncbi:hypothetical protein EDC01DRAFT_669108 [Geopyxis carbonaria]|nr:hypothetical protein EDC01DRAFT_669108 [Geopyxis carbonaria]
MSRPSPTDASAAHDPITSNTPSQHPNSLPQPLNTPSNSSNVQPNESLAPPPREERADTPMTDADASEAPTTPDKTPSSPADTKNEKNKVKVVTTTCQDSDSDSEPDEFYTLSEQEEIERERAWNRSDDDSDSSDSDYNEDSESEEEDSEEDEDQDEDDEADDQDNEQNDKSDKEATKEFKVKGAPNIKVKVPETPLRRGNKRRRIEPKPEREEPWRRDVTGK